MNRSQELQRLDGPDQAEQATTVDVLRLADRRLRAVAPDDVYEMCAIVRRAAAALARVDSFYVGLYAGDRMLFMPYVFGNGEDLSADSTRFGRQGLSSWIRASAKPYRYADDDGRLIHSGTPMGDARPSADALVVPIFDRAGTSVIGMLNAQSDVPDSFDDRFLAGIEWLAKALSIALSRGAQDAEMASLYADFPELDSGRAYSASDVMHAAIDRLDDIARRVTSIDQSVEKLSPEDYGAALVGIKEHCRRSAAELTMMAVRATEDTYQQRPEAMLTAREFEIAELIATESLTNTEIANRLTISEKTVKTHVSSILNKLGIRQRSEVAWLMGSHARDS